MKQQNKYALGYIGKVLKVDLSSKKFEQVDLDPELAEKFFGGRGLGVAYLTKYFLKLEEHGKYNNAFKELDPLSIDNVIIISTSPTTGTKMPTSGRFHMNYK